MNLLELQSDYQHIEIKNDAAHPGEVILALDGSWQLNTFFEFKYHEALVTLPMVAAPDVNNILICGAGDGMSMREALRFPDVGKVTQVEIDPAMIRLFRDTDYARFNSFSLGHDKAKVIVGDAIQFLRDTDEIFDVIVSDFPSPTSGNIGKDYPQLFSAEVMHLYAKRLAPHGVLTMQASLGVGTIASIVRNLKDMCFNVWEYDAFYDVKGSHDSFLVASKHCLTQQRQIPAKCRWASPDRVRIAFSEVTEISEREMEYYRFFCHSEDIEYGLDD